MKNKKLLNQILKFGVVGGISFLIDFIIYTAIIKILTFDKAYIIAGVLGFSISLIFNYLASMKWVFVRRDDTSRKKEFIIFTVLSLIGLVLNEVFLILYVECMDAMVGWIHAIHVWFFGVMEGFNIHAFADVQEFVEFCAKIFATALVMVYNFVSRKMTLEKKEDKEDTKESETEEA
ncbi:MAG: GtrA family protein [Lachnospiraceae bacterium]|nr:GtrA family protein [Lachnospiraceae bacterium]MBR6485165.1 GtrA family protein [Lachnospiraceae bacterium]